MEFQIYIKIKNLNKYELREITTMDGNREFFSNLLKSVEQELDNIKNDLLSFDNVNLIRPSHEDPEINSKIEKLVNIRKTNLETKEKLKEALAELEFIQCDHCGNKMYKKPINVSFRKIGKNYIINSENMIDIKYNFSCENCNFFIEEDLYYQILNIRKKRKELIEDGYNYVPNDFGFWHYINNNESKKPPEFDNEPPNYTYKRVFENAFEDVDGVNELHLHVYDICQETGEKIKIF
jgi:hypothetical protein